MAFRSLWFWLACACLGCQAMGPQEPAVEESDAAEAAQTAAELWEQGQDAMRKSQPGLAVRCYEKSLALDPRLNRNHLSLAAAYLENGDDASACLHLEEYVGVHPDELGIRVHLADLQLRMHKLTDARREFDRCVAGAQDRQEPAYGPLIHCHARLMEIAEEAEDSYGEHLHRGIGLSLLARQRGKLPDPDGELSTESLLCRAAAELTAAHEERPEEARPSFYLSEVWSMLDQRQPAIRFLKHAADKAPFSDMTAAEKRRLQVQCHCMAGEQQIK
jgi:tetratricopeptide (TPR) repeat protein